MVYLEENIEFLELRSRYERGSQCILRDEGKSRDQLGRFQICIVTSYNCCSCREIDVLKSTKQLTVFLSHLGNIQLIDKSVLSI